MGTLALTAGLGLTLGAGVTGYSVWETRRFIVRTVDVAVLPQGAPELRVLQLTDLHLRPTQRLKRDWIRSLGALRPDLVVSTGDNLAHRDAVPAVLDSYGDLLDVPGVFVLGSNDYFEPTARNPFQYLLTDRGRRHVESPQLPWRELKRRFADAGWLDLNNNHGELAVSGITIAFAGVDDPHLNYDDLRAVSGPARQDVDVTLAVTHAPYLRVLDQFAADGYDLTLAGHTHGGQVCLPGGRALVTNCDLEPARAKGLHRHPAQAPLGQAGANFLHVSAGLGTSPYAQLRLFCRPEATLLRLTPRA